MKQGNLFSFLLLALSITGCNNSDQQIAEIAIEAATEQAAQNERISEAHKEVAAGAKRLVEAESQARTEVIALQRDLRQDQAVLAKQRDALESERISLNHQRQRESHLGNLCFAAGIIVACLAPLVLAGMAIWHLREPPTSDELTEVAIHLLDELPPTQPTLPDARARPQLPAPSDESS